MSVVYGRIVLAAVVVGVVILGGTNVPLFYSFAFDVDPCIPDPLEPEIKPMTQTEGKYSGKILKREDLARLAENRWMGYIQVGDQRFRICVPMTTLYQQNPTGEFVNMKYEALRIRAAADVEYIHYKKTTTDVATLVRQKSNALKVHAGKVIAVYPEAYTLVIIESLAGEKVRQWPVKVEPGTEVVMSERIPDSMVTDFRSPFRDTPIALTEIRPGDSVTVEAIRKGGKAVASSVKVTFRGEAD